MALKPYVKDDSLLETDRWLDSWNRRVYKYGLDPWVPPSSRWMDYDYDWDLSPYRTAYLDLPWHRRYGYMMDGIEKEYHHSVQYLGRDGFKVSIDLRKYKPHEITVRTKNNVVFIEARHEERPNYNGFVSRKFFRQYVLPYTYDADKVTSSLSSDGWLTIKAPPPPPRRFPLPSGNEKVIEILRTGPARLSIKN